LTSGSSGFSAVQTPFVIELYEPEPALFADQQMFFYFAETRLLEQSLAVLRQVIVGYMIGHDSRQPASSGQRKTNYGPGA